jgi:acylglycerol lipase
LILHGTGDAVTEVEGSRQLCARAASTDKTLKLYEGLYHDLLNEPEKESVRADVIEWIRQRT